MNPNHARVYKESVRFRAALPQLLKGPYYDHWVVFRDGVVVSAHDSSEEAYAAGIEKFGVFGGQVIALVTEEPW